MTTYYEKLKSPQWQKKRLEILNERGFKCESCLDEFNQLHVHHKIYKKGLNPWSYPNHNYSVLCDECHKDAHKTIDLFNEFIGCFDSAGFFDQRGILAFMYGFLPSGDDEPSVLFSLHEKFDNLGLVDSDAYKLGELMHTVWNSLGDDDFELGLYNIRNKSLNEIFQSLAVNYGDVDSKQGLIDIVSADYE